MTIESTARGAGSEVEAGAKGYSCTLYCRVRHIREVSRSVHTYQ